MRKFVRMEEWDLHAVVRGCIGAVEAGESSGNNNFAPLRVAEERFLFVHDDDDYKPSFYPLSPQTILTSSFAVPQEPKSSQNRQKPRSVSIASEVSPESEGRTDGVTGEVIKSKKSKKYLQKRVVQQMNEADLSSDMWAWRKYGQKPIKASPYPRSYYRCSSSKGCLARKQVERNPLNPEIFIVTFTNEHTHALPTRRNSLAGSTRTKPTIPKSSVKDESQAPSITSLDSDTIGQHKTVAGSDSDKILDRDLSPDMMLRDEFFLGWDTVEGFLTRKEFAFDGCFFD